jgi:hypothetical protein
MPANKTQETFILQAKQQHGDRYDYSRVAYKEAHSKIEIICQVHGVFTQEPNEHLKGCGCPLCAVYSKKHPNAKLTQDEFIKKASIVHQNKYTYEKVIYVTSKINVIITCPIHGDFNQTPNAHICNRGCPICASSTGELKIQRWLKENGIDFVRQKIFKTAYPYNKLRFDFFLPTQNILIEFNGAQHYRPVDYFNGLIGYNKQVDSDKRKKEFSNINKIRLVVIPYWDFEKTEQILSGIMMPTAR